MKPRLLPLLLLFLLLASCKREIPLVDIGIDDFYRVTRMQKLQLSPEYRGDGVQWIEHDSVLSTQPSFVFCKGDTGTFMLTLKILDKSAPIVQNITIQVREEEVAYSPYISRVLEYKPAPGQFVNVMPQYEEGDTEADMVRKAEEALVGNNATLITLGAYGGYVTFAFDHCVMNAIGKPDFRVLGNALYAASSDGALGGSAEAGIVMVSVDANLNGLPDDAWYELAGSHYTASGTKHRYAITYTRPLDAASNVPWRDNMGSNGAVECNKFHTQPYYPQWIEGATLEFEGTLLPNNAVQNSSGWFMYAFDWGYVDNHPNSEEAKNDFCIEWAVDADGRQVHLPYIDFVRVYTALNQTCGWLGETSTEVMMALDLNLVSSN